MPAQQVQDNFRFYVISGPGRKIIDVQRPVNLVCRLIIKCFNGCIVNGKIVRADQHHAVRSRPEGVVTQLHCFLHAVTCGSKEYLCPLINIWDRHVNQRFFLFHVQGIEFTAAPKYQQACDAASD